MAASRPSAGASTDTNDSTVGAYSRTQFKWTKAFERILMEAVDAATEIGLNEPFPRKRVHDQFVNMVEQKSNDGLHRWPVKSGKRLEPSIQACYGRVEKLVKLFAEAQVNNDPEPCNLAHEGEDASISTHLLRCVSIFFYNRRMEGDTWSDELTLLFLKCIMSMVEADPGIGAGKETLDLGKLHWISGVYTAWEKIAWQVNSGPIGTALRRKQTPKDLYIFPEGTLRETYTLIVELRTIMTRNDYWRSGKVFPGAERPAQPRRTGSAGSTASAPAALTESAMSRGPLPFTSTPHRQSPLRSFDVPAAANPTAEVGGGAAGLLQARPNDPPAPINTTAGAATTLAMLPTNAAQRGATGSLAVRGKEKKAADPVNRSLHRVQRSGGGVRKPHSPMIRHLKELCPPFTDRALELLEDKHRFQAISDRLDFLREHYPKADNSVSDLAYRLRTTLSLLSPSALEQTEHLCEGAINEGQVGQKAFDSFTFSEAFVFREATAIRKLIEEGVRRSSHTEPMDWRSEISENEQEEEEEVEEEEEEEDADDDDEEEEEELMIGGQRPHEKHAEHELPGLMAGEHDRVNDNHGNEPARPAEGQSQTSALLGGSHPHTPPGSEEAA